MGRLAPVTLILLLLAAGPAPAGAQTLMSPDQIMPTSEIRAGMIATGKSVFHGTDIEEFHLEILGVAPKARGGSDVILARVLDGVLIERQSSILQGMSGSPVYVGGRLIGAIAFSWAFAKEPIAGITPIEDMLRVLEAGAPAAAGSAPGEKPAAASLEHPVVIQGRAFDRVRILEPLAAGAPVAPATPDTAEPAGTLTLRPVSAVFLIAGMSERGMERLRELLEPFGATVAQGVGGGSDLAGATLEAGSALGVKLISGDFEAGAIGTVTAVIGDKVLAFGHPMMSMGETDLTMTGAYIQAIVPSYATSMKMGITGKPLGRITQDRLWAVGGSTGPPAQSIPITVAVSDPARSMSQTFHAEIARNRLLSPGLAASVALSSIDRAWEHIGEGTADITIEVDDGQRTIRRSDITYNPADAAVGVMSQLVAPLAAFMDNEFGAIPVQAVRLQVRLNSKRESARLERISVRPGKHKAGEPLQVNVLLRPFKGEAVEKSLEFKLPPDLPSGPLRIGVAGGSQAQQLRGALGLAPPRPFSLDQLVNLYQTAEPADQLVAFAALPSMGMSVEGRRLTALPGYMLEALTGTRSSVILPEPDFLKVSLDTDWIIEGRQVTTVEIEGKPGATKGRPPQLRPSPPPGGPPKEGEGEEEAPPEEGGDYGTSPFMAAVAAGAPVAADAGPAEAADTEAAEQGEKKEEEKPAEKPVGRAPSSLTQARRADFLPGEFDDIACNQDGVLSLAPAAKTVAKLEEPVISAMLARGDAVCVATAPDGKVRMLSADGQVRQTWDTGALLITCLAAGPGEGILAGAAPGGRILSLSPEGKTEEYFSTGEDTVWAIASAPGGGFYAGTGAGGKVFAITAPGAGRLLAQLPATNVYSLAVSGEVLYAGTGNAGVLYAIEPSGEARAAYESDQQSIASLAVGPEGDIYAGTAPDAAVVRLRSGRQAEQIMQAEGDYVAALAAGPDGLLYAVTSEDGVVYELDPAHEASRVLRKPERGQAIALALAQDGAVYSGESNPAAVIRLGPERAQKGVYTSAPQEAASGTRWGVANSSVELPQGTTATFQTRSGDGADPDDHWSPWSAPVELGNATPVASPRGRFLQYRIALGAEQAGATPSARDLQVVYLPPNQEPVVTINAPKPAERLRQKFDLKWKAEDADGDTLIYDLAYSADGGQTWTDIKSDVEQKNYSWDTKDLKDGAYLLRVVASDRVSNPGAARDGEARQLVWVDNTPPTVVALRSSVAVEGGRVIFRGAVSDEMSPLSGVDYRADDGKWRAATISDGLVGTQQVLFSVQTESLAAGDHTLQVRAFDQAGNSGQDEIKAKVEAAPAEEPKTERAPAGAP